MLAATTIAAVAAPGPGVALAAPAGLPPAPVAAPGTSSRRTGAAPGGVIAGFLSQTSAAPGDRLFLFVDTPAATFNVRIFRLGWYDGGSRSRRLIDSIAGLPGGRQPAPSSDPTTGLISAASWHLSIIVTVGDWPTGLYDVRLKDAEGRESSIPLVVRDDDHTHDLLFQHACATDQAYNNWGGRSLYNFNSAGEPTVGGGPGAVKVSFDRPFTHNEGLGQAVEWEMQMIRWLDANGWDVAYASDLDVHANPDFARNVRAVIQAGHSEYWSREMRDHLELARQDGKGLGFFTGDTGSIAVRFEPSILGPNRVQVCYRDALKDPLASVQPSRSTVAWFQSPLYRPVQDLIGVGTNSEIARSAPWVANGTDDLPEIFGGTGLRDGDRVENLVGYEYDGLGTPGAREDLPSGLRILGRSVVAPLRSVQGPLQLAASCDLPADALPSAGLLRASIQTVEAGPTWRLELEVTSAAGGPRRLVYLAGEGAPLWLTVDQVLGIRIPLGRGLAAPGWGTFERDLARDYALGFGAAPRDLAVTSAILRGTLAIATLSIAAPDGSTTSLVGGEQGTSPPAWTVRSGWGSLRRVTGDDGAGMLVLLPTVDRRDDVAHTVLIREPDLGPVVAVGTVQWSWALDDFGPRGDRLGNITAVDPRIQRLTANLLGCLAGVSARVGAPAGPS